MFYKVIYEHVVVDIIAEPHWVIWASKSGRFVLTDETTANGIVSSKGDEVFHLGGTAEFVNFQGTYRTVSVMKIEETEYLSLKSQIVEKTIDENGAAVSLEQLIENKIDEMSQTCEDCIMAGFDIVLSDGVKHHFSLQLADQLKISKLNDRAAAGEDFLPYHADNEPCKIYSSQDIIAINSMMERIVEFQITYFNSLKMYIRGMTNRDDVINVQYGADIPEGYQSDVLKLLLAQHGGGDST